MAYQLSTEFETALNIAIRILKEAGGTEIYLFGSNADGTAGDDSDLDIAVRGIPAKKFFSVYGRLLMELTVPVDLLTLDQGGDFAEYLQVSGSLKRVA